MSEYDKLLIESGLELGCLTQLMNGVLFLVHLLYQEESIRYTECCTTRKFLNPQSIHVLRVIGKELVVIEFLTYHNVIVGRASTHHS